MAAVNGWFEFGGDEALFWGHGPKAEAAAALADVVGLEAVGFKFEERPVDFVDEATLMAAADTRGCVDFA